MGKTLDFTKIKKQYLTVTLPDEDNTKLMVCTPTKRLLDDLLGLQDVLSNLENGEIDDDATNDLYIICAKLMSRNKAGIKVTADELADCLDLEDLVIFCNSYAEFINEVADSKN